MYLPVKSGCEVENAYRREGVGRKVVPYFYYCLERKQSSVWKSQAHPNEAATIENSSNSAPLLVNEPKVASPIEKDNHNGKPSGPSTSIDASSVSTFMNQVSELVKLVDSRDIVELELKQAGYELMIRKKEALPPPPVSQQQFSYPVYHSPQAPPPPVATSAPASAPPSKAVPALPPPKSSASSHPPLKCPMAGTFYRSPGPGEPPFVGDKVQKGQVVCIIEAMKLMNEIE
ncbi:biotin carboxyl carrier protein of acetyl-CoA carboxylase chloroplastic-like, partial [Trifolium medium]|nr:biotin carboxyl carrier protein of acetyl-CoA carboxylase chloroplastic-like [Trifolium medium]